MKRIRKGLALILVIAMLFSGAPIFAQEALGRPVRARHYYEIYYDGSKVSDTVKVDSFEPEKWTIHYYKKVNGRQVGQTQVLEYPDNYQFELRRYADTVDPSKITAKTKVRFDNFRIKTIRGEEKLPDPPYFPTCFIEPTVTPKVGDPKDLQALLDKLTPIMAKIQYLPWKDPKDVDEGIDFFNDPPTDPPEPPPYYYAIVIPMANARFLLKRIDDDMGGYGKPTQTEYDEFEQIIRKAYEEGKKHLKKGKRPVNPTPPPVPAAALSLRVMFYLDVAKSTPDPTNLPFELNISEDSEILKGLRKGSLDDLEELTQRLLDAVIKRVPEGYEADEESFRSVASAYLLDKMSNDLEVRLIKKQEPGVLKNVVAFDIRNGEWVYDRIYGLRMRDGWTSVSNIARAFYQNSETVQKDYLYAGFVTKDLKPCLVLREAYLEKPELWKEKYLKLLEKTKADIVLLVVPKTMGITVEHIFPEGTQTTLSETVDMPYVEWAALQSSSQFMKLPEVFRTRIQKVNEQGYAFQEIRFYSGLEEVTGFLGAWDWAGMDLGGNGKKACKAKVLYQLAPENRVQAGGQGTAQPQMEQQVQSSAQANKQVPGQGQMQAQIKAEEVQNVQGPVAVAGASMSNRGNQVNGTLPVTGASDSIFLFLSSVALMAVGILFFKKH